MAHHSNSSGIYGTSQQQILNSQTSLFVCSCRWMAGEEQSGFISVDKCLESLVSRWMDLGANWIGGCCRFTPQHIARIKTTVIGRSQQL